MDPVVEAKNLTKKFGDFLAVDRVSFTLYPSECFGFLGPNGAGKTTTIRLIYGFSPMGGGELTVFGQDMHRHWREIKNRIGVCQQDNNLDPDLTVWENLLVFARYFNLKRDEARKRAAELLDFFGLTPKKNARIPELSGGLLRRLVIARALINAPTLLILDEPTTGLDPQSRHQLWEKLRQLKAQGLCILLTTHYLDEAAQMCDRLVIMDQGRVLVEGAPVDLVRRYIGGNVIEVEDPGAGSIGPLKRGTNKLRAGTQPDLDLYDGWGRAIPPDFPRILHRGLYLAPGHPGRRIFETDRPGVAGMNPDNPSSVPSTEKSISWRFIRVWQRNWDVYVRTWKINFIPPILEPIFYLLAFGAGLGYLVGSITWEGKTVSYAAFIAPGLLAVNIMQNSFFETTYASFVRMYYQKTFDAILATPLNLEEVILGEIVWGASRSFMATVVMMMVLTGFGTSPIPRPWRSSPLPYWGDWPSAPLACVLRPSSPRSRFSICLFFFLSPPCFFFPGLFFPWNSFLSGRGSWPIFSH